ncbi:hypothetical protein HAX54_019631 [Datura stramonium]|uniref:Uncharacterized protein n=1 Tax=Datura stramonium TaxID=4076 RepID=A0ABS8URX0_DATST|nr:hypothetical protein [Datura stramonium]
MAVGAGGGSEKRRVVVHDCFRRWSRGVFGWWPVVREEMRGREEGGGASMREGGGSYCGNRGVSPEKCGEGRKGVWRCGSPVVFSRQWWDLVETERGCATGAGRSRVRVKRRGVRGRGKGKGRLGLFGCCFNRKLWRKRVEGMVFFRQKWPEVMEGKKMAGAGKVGQGRK